MLTLWPQTSDSIVIDWSDGWGAKFSSCFVPPLPHQTPIWWKSSLTSKKLKFVSDSSPGHPWVWQQNKRAIPGWGVTGASQRDIPPPTTVPCPRLSSWDSAGHAQLLTGLFTYMCTPQHLHPHGHPNSPSCYRFQIKEVSGAGLIKLFEGPREKDQLKSFSTDS